MDNLIPRYPLHISERIISFLEFEGNFRRGELHMWAELNSYPYLKRRIAKKISIVFYVPVLKQGLPECTIEHNLKDETIELLSRCTSSFFFLVQLKGIGPDIFQTNLSMDGSERRQLNSDISLGQSYCIIDVFNFLRQSPRQHYRYLEVLHSFEFMRLMRQRQYKPENMYVTKKWLQKKYAMEALFFPPRLLTKGQYTEIRKPFDYNFVPAFTNPQSSELGDFADNIYVKQGYQYCKIESFGMRLLILLKILMDPKFQKRCFESAWE